MRNPAIPLSTTDNALSRQPLQELAEQQRSTTGTAAASAVAQSRPYGMSAGLHPVTAVSSSNLVPRGVPQPQPAPRQPRCSPFSSQGIAALSIGHDSSLRPRVTPKEEDPTSTPQGVMVGMSRVPSLQLMFEIDDESDSQEPRPNASELERQKATLRHLQDELRLQGAEELQVRGVVTGALEAARARGEQLSCDALAKLFHGLGYQVCVRTALGGGQGLSCMENLSHQFLVLQMPSPASGTTSSLIVDIEFKEQFELAQPSEQYEELLQQLSPVFIGSQTKVQNVVVLLCDEMSLAFKAQGQVPPPWRRASSMLSKWCPRRSEDKTPVSDEASGPKPLTSAKRNMFRSPWKNTTGKVAPTPQGLPWQQQQVGGSNAVVSTSTAGFTLQTC